MHFSSEINRVSLNFFISARKQSLGRKGKLIHISSFDFHFSSFLVLLAFLLRNQLCLFEFFRFCFRTVPRTKTKTDSYLLICFPFLLADGEMLLRFLLGNQACLSEFFHFCLETVPRTKKKSDTFLFIRFPFLLIDGEMVDPFLSENEPLLLENFHFCWKQTI
jgi:hypothetical protein